MQVLEMIQVGNISRWKTNHGINWNIIIYLMSLPPNKAPKYR